MAAPHLQDEFRSLAPSWLLSRLLVLSPQVRPPHAPRSRLWGHWPFPKCVCCWLRAGGPFSILPSPVRSVLGGVPALCTVVSLSPGWSLQLVTSPLTHASSGWEAELCAFSPEPTEKPQKWICLKDKRVLRCTLSLLPLLLPLAVKILTEGHIGTYSFG